MTGDKKGLMRGQSDYFYWLQKERWRGRKKGRKECAMPWSREIFSSNKKDGHPPEVCGGVRQKERSLDEMHVCKMRWVLLLSSHAFDSYGSNIKKTISTHQIIPKKDLMYSILKLGVGVRIWLAWVRGN